MNPVYIVAFFLLFISILSHYIRQGFLRRPFPSGFPPITYILSMFIVITRGLLFYCFSCLCCFYFCSFCCFIFVFVVFVLFLFLFCCFSSFVVFCCFCFVVFVFLVCCFCCFIFVFILLFFKFCRFRFVVFVDFVVGFFWVVRSRQIFHQKPIKSVYCQYKRVVVFIVFVLSFSSLFLSFFVVFVVGFLLSRQFLSRFPPRTYILRVSMFIVSRSWLLLLLLLLSMLLSVDIFYQNLYCNASSL